MKLGPPVQLAYAVNDLESAALAWVASHGAGPFFVMKHIAVSEVLYCGRPATFDHSSAYGQLGPIMVELVCDHTVGPSPFPDVDAPGGQGLHHVAHFVDDVTAMRAHLTAQGCAEALRARTASGVWFYSTIAAAARGWDGKEPIRMLG